MKSRNVRAEGKRDRAKRGEHGERKKEKERLRAEGELQTRKEFFLFVAFHLRIVPFLEKQAGKDAEHYNEEAHDDRHGANAGEGVLLPGALVEKEW